jgi:Phage protein Gp138 N-terminal domain
MDTLPTIPQNANGSEPGLRDALDTLKKEIFLYLNCHHVGTIQTFDSDKQTATATINYTKAYYVQDPVSKRYIQKLVAYPVVMDCPVICLGGGNGALTFPISAGDECFILFNDRDINNWFSGITNVAPLTARLHSFADGIIIVGIRSLSNTLENYDSSRAALRGSKDGQTMVGVGETLVKIANATTTLNTLLQSLVTAIESLVTQTAAITVTAVTPGVGTSGPPSNAATIAAIGVQLVTIGTQISGLLE